MSKRVTQLDRTVRMINEIENTIRFQSTDIGSIMIELENRQEYADLTFLEVCRSALRGGHSVQQALVEALHTGSANLYFNDRDRDLLADFFAKLGTSDLEGQINNCLYFKNQLEEQLREAKTSYEQKHKLYVFLGLFSGLVFALVII